VTCAETVATSPNLAWFRGAVAECGLALDSPRAARAVQTAAVTSMLYDDLRASGSRQAWLAFAKSVDAFHAEVRRMQDAADWELRRIATGEN
jgi:hypothetical protein